MDALEQEHERKMQQEEFTLLNRNMNDKMLKLRAYEAFKDIYGGRSVNEIKLVDTGSEASMNSAIARFSALFNSQK